MFNDSEISFEQEYSVGEEIKEQPSQRIPPKPQSREVHLKKTIDYADTSLKKTASNKIQQNQNLNLNINLNLKILNQPNSKTSQFQAGQSTRTTSDMLKNPKELRQQILREIGNLKKPADLRVHLPESKIVGKQQKVPVYEFNQKLQLNQKTEQQPSAELTERSNSGKMQRREINGKMSVFAKKSQGGFIGISQISGAGNVRNNFSDTRTQGRLSKEKNPENLSREKSKRSYSREVIQKYLEDHGKNKKLVQEDRKIQLLSHMLQDTKSETIRELKTDQVFLSGQRYAQANPSGSKQRSLKITNFDKAVLQSQIDNLKDGYVKEFDRKLSERTARSKFRSFRPKLSEQTERSMNHLSQGILKSKELSNWKSSTARNFFRSRQQELTQESNRSGNAITEKIQGLKSRFTKNLLNKKPSSFSNPQQLPINFENKKLSIQSGRKTNSGLRAKKLGGQITEEQNQQNKKSMIKSEYTSTGSVHGYQTKEMMILAGYSPKKAKAKQEKTIKQSKRGSILEQKQLLRGSKTVRSNHKSKILDASSLQKQIEVQSISSLLKNFGVTTKSTKKELNSATNSLKNLPIKSTKFYQNGKPNLAEAQTSLGKSRQSQKSQADPLIQSSKFSNLLNSELNQKLQCPIQEKSDLGSKLLSSRNLLNSSRLTQNHRESLTKILIPDQQPEAEKNVTLSVASLVQKQLFRSVNLNNSNKKSIQTHQPLNSSKTFSSILYQNLGNSRKSMNSIYEKNYRRNLKMSLQPHPEFTAKQTDLQLLGLKSGSQKANLRHFQSVHENVLTAGQSTERNKSRQSGSGTNRLSNAFHRSVKL